MTARLSLGMDIGGTNARAALVATLDWDSPSPRTEILSEARTRIRGDTSPPAIARVVAELTQTCCSQSAINPANLSGVGIGIAGQLSANRRIVINGPNLGWRAVPFADIAETQLGAVPVSVFNDLSGITWGEYRCGSGIGYRDLMVVYVGTGVGCGLIANGKLYEGGQSKAGEIGHSKVVVRGGRVCGCGELGCMETYIGGRYLELRAVADLNAGIAEDLRYYLGLPIRAFDPAETVLPSQIDLAAAAGVGYAVRLWDEAADKFGQVISTCLALQNPTGWLLGGGVLDHCPHLRQRLIESAKSLTVKAIWDDVTVLEPKLGDYAGLLGGALLALEAPPSAE